MEQHAEPARSAPGPRAARSLAQLHPGPRERLDLALVLADCARRGFAARLRRSRALRWRYRSPVIHELLIEPPELRAQDPSFLDELGSGRFGLAGGTAQLGELSPFAIRPPSQEWARELHGFGWLRHLACVGSQEADEVARRLAVDWVRGRASRSPAWRPDVVARRIISWLSHAGLLFDGADHRTHALFTRSLADQVTFLGASWPQAPDGYRRLLCLIALVLADVCIAGGDQRLARSERLLAAEIERQVLPDGGHISRNPAVLVELLLDLLPLRQCFATRHLQLDRGVLTAIGRIAPMLRHLRLGDGSLARFNGMGTTEHDTLATVLGYDAAGLKLAQQTLASGYVRLECGSTIVVVDAGPAPALELAPAACAGCLSFEMSSGAQALLVNGGAPRVIEARLRGLARATASHNTLTLGDQSSARMVRSGRLERQLGGAPIRCPDRVSFDLRASDSGATLEASHDGYAARFGVLHTRTLSLDHDGGRLTGLDKLNAAGPVMRFAYDLPTALHFHLHPDVQARPATQPGAAELLLPSGEAWRFATRAAALSIEPSTHFAATGGPEPAQQIVLRSSCYGEVEISWTLERLASRRAR